MTIEEINQQFDDLQAANAKEQADTVSFIADLKAQIAAGNPVSQAQLDALSARITGTAAQVRDFDINNVTPPVVVAPVPPAARKH